jgi:WD40 repeat protein
MLILLNFPPSRRVTQLFLLILLTVSSNLMMNLSLAAQSTDLPTQQPATATTTAAVLEPLQQALKAKNWAVADQETRRLIDPYSVSWPPSPEVKLTPELIRSIDQAWSDASNGRFGFSVQAQIWQEVKRQFSNDERAAIEAMRDRVGWKLTQPRAEVDFISSDWLNEDEINYSSNAPVGHLPWVGVSNKVVSQMQSVESCGSCTIDAMALRDSRFYGHVPGLMQLVQTALPPTIDTTWRSPKLLHRLNLASLYPKNSQVRATHYGTMKYGGIAVATTDQANRSAISWWDISTGKGTTILKPAASNGAIEALYANYPYIWAGNAKGELTFWDQSPYVELKTKTWSAHTDGVTAIAMGMDPEVVISGGRDRTVKVWKVKTGELLRTMRLTAGEVNATPVRGLLISPDQQRLAIATDRTIQLWNLQTGQLIKVMFQSSNLVNPVLPNSMAFSHDGQFLATLDHGNSIKLWNASNGARVVSLIQHQSPIEALSFTPNGLQLISRDRSQLVLFWDLAKYRSDRSISVASGNRPKPIDTSDAIATAKPITLSPDAQTFAVPLKLPNGTMALDLRLVVNGDRLTVLPNASQASFTTDNRFLITGGPEVQVWQPDVKPK